MDFQNIFPFWGQLNQEEQKAVAENVLSQKLQKGDILLHGHTHIPAWEQFGEENIYMNPGSVSIPKNGSEHGYMTLNDGKFEWKNLEGTVYHTEEI